MDIERFLQTKPSRCTRDSYRWALGKVLGWCDDQSISVTSLTPAMLDVFMDTQHWGATTRYHIFTTCKSYLAWLMAEPSPFARAKMKRPRARMQRTLSVEMANRLLASIDTSTDYGRRTLAMITLMLNTGLRSFEVRGALLRDLDLPGKRLQVLCKGDIWRMAHFSSYTQSCLESWLGVRTYWAKRTVTIAPTIFVTERGKKMPGSYLRRIFVKLGIRIGIRFSPHDLRRTFACLSTQAGAPSRIVMAAGGWTSVESFLRYTRAIGPDDIAPYDPIDFLLSH